MKYKTFTYFVAPSVLMMILFIAIPLISVFIQSFYLTSNKYQIKQIETCTPGFSGTVCKTEEKQVLILDNNSKPITETKFVGFQSYQKLLDSDEVAYILEDEEASFFELLDSFLTLNFYKALRFTLTFTLFTLPLVVGLGLLIAMSVNKLFARLRGPVIFISLLPFIITPIIGAISIKWLFIGDGILTVFLEYLIEEDITVFANGWAIEFLMMFYRVWHSAPFAFVVFYAGLQTVNQDILDASIVDGASRIQRFRFVIIPHLMPLIVFVSLIHLMDAFRVFEEIIGFSSQAHRISLQWLTYDLLTPDGAGNRSISRASASSMLTMIGIILLLIPVLYKTWKEHKIKK